jgi:periplasmic divalent cation tolerance protein
MGDEILVLVTCPASESENLAKTVVQERLAACVNVVPGIRSIYLWEGKLCNEIEELLVMKTTGATWIRLRDRVKELHSYDVPEIISIPIKEGHQPYLDWLKAAVAGT